MRDTPSFPDIISIGCYLAPRKSVARALISGEYDSESHLKTNYREICCETELFPSEMALKAMNIHRHEKEDISTLIYCHLHHQGGTFLWSPASYLSSYFSVENGVCCFNLNQGCNGLMIALEQVCQQNFSHHHYLLVASDRFDGTNFNRWKSDYGIIYGDAAVSILVGPPGEGAYAIEGMKTVWKHKLEALHRFTDIRSDDPHEFYDIKKSKKSYLNLHGNENLRLSTLKSIELAIHQVMVSASVSLHDIQHVFLPNLGSGLIESSYLPALGELVNKTHFDFGQNSGHLGCSDIFAHLYTLDNENRIKSGELILAISAGAGFSWTACLLRKR
ncbi:hypothetical protein BOO29_15710 [Vibrio navarrensis]|uniref:Beta-ketoacyl-[acyl-carrier-protein] synthase III C-terminal domain-containing protein n=1 Tax=Vibrio navarrensis TaxID=29495 RepID=A0A099MBU9_9VIBR|nr:ketoacyl-ACP synthase III family protein [Vibrio navarrensis]EGR2796851.1 hypothetical protein [Vibrio navarrensis]KGK12026.1 hypothetical protein EA26_12165 [Vibrio navarrensis]KGK17953.1 hypothetical protein EA25_10580 [Vibrio navarrensis]MBE4573008.1 hypothetical protein [Vibrio navarrensis]MBE4581668.1 hypothetical protein [Vibrio navarrensis]